MSLETRGSSRLEDPGAEALDRISTVWERHGRTVLIAVGVIAVVGVGAFLLQRSRAGAEERAATRFAEANSAFWQGDYAGALAGAREVITQHGSTRVGVDAHRLAADASFWQGDFRTAVAEYREYLKRDGSGVLADGVRRSMAYALESHKDSTTQQRDPAMLKEAATLYDGLVGKFERESSAEFLFSSARVHRALGQPAEAKARLERLTQEFGETSIAQRARIELAEIAAAN